MLLSGCAMPCCSIDEVELLVLYEDRGAANGASIDGDDVSDPTVDCRESDWAEGGASSFRELLMFFCAAGGGCGADDGASKF